MGECVLTRRSVVKNEYQKLADVIVSGSAVTQIDITGLNLVKGEEYVLVSTYLHSGSNPLILVNDNTTVTNYYTQRLDVNNTVVGGVRYNTSYLGAFDSGYFSFISTKIKLTNNGYFIWQSNTIRSYNTVNMFMVEWYGTSTFTMTSINKISIKSESANGIGIGSRFQLYKVGGV